MVELLVPAGSPEAVTAAVQNGADAVYMSFDELSDCRQAENFSDSAFEASVRYCRVRGCRVYLSLNAPVRDDELQKAGGLALRAQRAGVDAVIVRDLGVYYILVIICYLFFEMVPINYRPVLIEGMLEASYPSSTTLLVLSVMPTLKFQADRRSDSPLFRRAVTVFVIAFSAFMVLGRVIAGVHWATDILGAVLLSSGLFILYMYAVRRADECKAGHQQGA